MSKYLFEMPEPFALRVMGEEGLFPVWRIFCVGRNYAAHAAEMGAEVDREAPWYFTKQAAHGVLSGAVLPYALGTSNLHHEMELAMALGGPAFRASLEEAEAAIYGYAAALDMTRRDRQQDGKDHRRPWSLGKDFEGSAVVAEITKADAFQPVDNTRISLAVNGEMRQDATLGEMVWSCAEIISHLSQFYHLGKGDLILTGTPAGVGPVVAGDKLLGEIAGLAPVELTLTAAE